ISSKPRKSNKKQTPSITLSLIISICKHFFIHRCFSGCIYKFLIFGWALTWFGVSVSGVERLVADWTIASASSSQKIQPTDT
ncbi:hypothetical protein ACI1O1_003492, partial [Escherichia coli]